MIEVVVVLEGVMEEDEIVVEKRMVVEKMGDGGREIFVKTLMVLERAVMVERIMMVQRWSR